MLEDEMVRIPGDRRAHIAARCVHDGIEVRDDVMAQFG
jgi:LDH2 family malate/lactate/ureidoglycolate dehydrogenase